MASIAQITANDTGARAKINAAITEANKVDGKADQTAVDALASSVAQRATIAALASEADARSAGDVALQSQITSLGELAALKASTSALTAETNARVAADTAEALARAEADAVEAVARADADTAEAEARAAADVALGLRIDGLPSVADLAAAASRPGDMPQLFASDLAGATPLDASATTITTDGRSAVIDGAGTVITLATYRIEPLRRYGVRFVIRRLIDTEDPAGDAIRFGLQWLRKDGSLHSTVSLANIVDVTIASGRLDYPYVIGTVTADDLDASAPAAAIYLRPFVHAFGSGKTAVEVIEVCDLTQAVEFSPDVSDIRRELAGYVQTVGSYVAKLEGVDDLVAAARDGSWIETGTVADARLSENVMLLDTDQLVTSVKTHTEALKLRDVLYVGDSRAWGGGATAEIIGDVNYFAIRPTDKVGGYLTLKEFGFNADATDPNGNVWTAEGGFKTTGVLTVTGSGEIGGDLAVTGATELAGPASLLSTVDVAGAGTFQSTLGVNGAATFASTVAITGTLGVGDAGTFSSTLHVVGNATLDADLSVGGDVAVAGILDVVGAATFGSTLDVVGAVTLDDDISVAGDGEVTGTFGVTGIATLASDLSVGGNGTVTGTLGVGQNAAFAASLQVDGDLTVDGAVTIVAGSITGIVDLAVADGGTGASTPSAARNNLGLAIGSDVQAHDATLDSLSDLGTAADRLAYTTGVDSWAETAFTAFARSLLDDADATAARATLVLDQVDNTSDVDKPVSTATQAALDDKAPLDSPAFTGTPVMPAYTVATLPAVSAAGGPIYVSDGAAGTPVLAFSDGTDWLRCDSLAAVSAT